MIARALMAWYADHVLPRCIDLVLSLPRFRELRPRATAGLAGRVLEIGFGSGANLAFYPREVREVLALEPSRLARRLARGRLDRALVPVRFVGSSGESIPLADASVDAVLSTWTLCTIPDVGRALGEVRRVLRPGGAFHFLEHGLAPDARTARWQRRLTPLQRRIAGGCELDRPIRALVAGAGLGIEHMEEFSLAGSRSIFWLSLGRAVRE
jgi:SAM-dependent methyltransferase